MSEESALTIMFKALIAFQSRIRVLEEQVSTLRDESEAMASNVYADIAELRANVSSADCDADDWLSVSDY